jgi:hypothetical protein
MKRERERARWGDGEIIISTPPHPAVLDGHKKKAPKVEGAHTFWFCLFLVSLDGATRKKNESKNFPAFGSVRDFFPLFHSFNSN